MELISKFEYEELTVYIGYQGSEWLPFSVYIYSELVYEDVFKPSPLHDIDSIDSMISLLGFILLGPGDVEQDFFDRRSCPVLDSWVETDENLTVTTIQLMINDYMFAEDEEWLADNQMSYEEATSILNYFKQQ